MHCQILNLALTINHLSAGHNKSEVKHIDKIAVVEAQGRLRRPNDVNPKRTIAIAVLWKQAFPKKVHETERCNP